MRYVSRAKFENLSHPFEMRRIDGKTVAVYTDEEGQEYIYTDGDRNYLSGYFAPNEDNDEDDDDDDDEEDDEEDFDDEDEEEDEDEDE